VLHTGRYIMVNSRGLVCTHHPIESPHLFFFWVLETLAESLDQVKQSPVPM
jgi:hypothetical protein